MPLGIRRNGHISISRFLNRFFFIFLLLFLLSESPPDYADPEGFRVQAVFVEELNKRIVLCMNSQSLFIQICHRNRYDKDVLKQSKSIKQNPKTKEVRKMKGAIQDESQVCISVHRR